MKSIPPTTQIYTVKFQNYTFKFTNLYFQIQNLYCRGHSWVSDLYFLVLRFILSAFRNSIPSAFQNHVETPVPNDGGGGGGGDRCMGHVRSPAGGVNVVGKFVPR